MESAPGPEFEQGHVSPPSLTPLYKTLHKTKDSGFGGERTDRATRQFNPCVRRTGPEPPPPTDLTL